MHCRSVSWCLCTFVAAIVLTHSIAQDSTSDSSTAESVQEVRPDRAADLGALLDHGYGSMVALVAGDTRLVAHRAVLAARSPVFQRILQDITVGEVATPGVEGPVLRQLVAYLYTLQAPQLPALAAQLLAAADLYGLPALKADCERQVFATLSVETAAAAAVVAVRHSSDSLRKAAIDYIRDHIFQVLPTQGWAEARNSQPQAMAEVVRLLSESASETGTPAPVDSGTSATPAAQPTSDRSQTPVSAAPPTAAAHYSRPHDEAADYRVSSSGPAGSGSFPYHTIQPHSDYSGHQTPTTAAPTLVAQISTHTDDDDDVSLLRSSAPAESGSSPRHATQPHSDYSDSQTPTTAATTMVPETSTHNDDPISLLRSLSPEEKTRKVMEAARIGDMEDLEALLAAGADVGARDKSMWTALHRAAENGHEEVARRLLAAGAAVDARDRWQQTPLHEAAEDGHAALVRLLLDAGAYHSPRSVSGRTPLHLAAEWGHTEAAAALLAAGADRAARDRWGNTPLDAARRYSRQEMEELLDSHRGPTNGAVPE